MNIRAFFALPLKSATVRRLADHADTLCGLDGRGEVEWSDSDNYHLTLCFLGEVSLEQVVALEQLCFEKLVGRDSFQVHLETTEYFKVNGDQALLAALTAVEPALAELQQTVLQITEAAGIGTRERDFKPHVTLGRLPTDAAFEPPDEWPPLDQLNLVDGVVLYQSKPAAGGSIYTPLFTIPLGTRSDTVNGESNLQAI